MEDNVKLVHLGRMGPLPEAVKTELLKTIEMTSKNTGMIFALALNYGGRAEIIDATKEIARRHKAGEIRLDEIDEKCISRHLYTAGIPDPDLLIRTANELRVSNFLLWQISYSEFYVTETLWPDFRTVRPGRSDTGLRQTHKTFRCCHVVRYRTRTTLQMICSNIG